MLPTFRLQELQSCINIVLRWQSYCMVPSAYGYHCVKPMYVYRQKQDGELLRHAEWGTIFAACPSASKDVISIVNCHAIWE